MRGNDKTPHSLQLSLRGLLAQDEAVSTYGKDCFTPLTRKRISGVYLGQSQKYLVNSSISIQTRRRR
jgi:hypothetical protein